MNGSPLPSTAAQPQGNHDHHGSAIQIVLIYQRKVTTVEKYDRVLTEMIKSFYRDHLLYEIHIVLY